MNHRMLEIDTSSTGNSSHLNRHSAITRLTVAAAIFLTFILGSLSDAQAQECGNVRTTENVPTEKSILEPTEKTVEQTATSSKPLKESACEKTSALDSYSGKGSTLPTNNPALSALDLANKYWRQRDELQGEHSTRIPYFCEGTYINYSTNNPSDISDYKKLPIFTSSNRSILDQNSVSLYGNISITQEGYHLQAQQAKINRQTRQATLSGNVIVQSPEGAFSGDSASISLNQRSAILENAEYLLFDKLIRGGAKTISVNQKTGIKINKGIYTACPPNNNWWVLKANEIDLNYHEQTGKTKHASLSIKGVPVAYIPYIEFPIGNDRKTGVLFPTLSNTGNGIDLTLPYYINIAPAIDATIAPRFVQDRGFMTEAELRWLNRFDRWSLSGAFLGNDKITNEDRWVYRIKENGAYKGRIFTHLDYTEISDNDYFDDYSLSSLSIQRQTHINQQASLSFNNRYWDIALLGQYYQTIDEGTEKPFEKAPELRLRYERDPKNRSLNFSVQSTLTYFESNNDITGTRLVSDLAVNYPWQKPGFFIVPKLGISNINYDLESSASDSRVDVTAPFGSIDTGLIFEKRKKKPDHSTEVKTIEPRLFYIYRPRKTQDELPLFDTTELTFSTAQLFRETRFSGRDRLDDANQLTAAITHRQFRANNMQTATTVGQIFYFEDRKVNIGETLNSKTDSHSSTVLQLNTDLNHHWYLLNTLLWDSQQGDIDEGTLSLRYRSEAEDYFANGRTIGNLNYHFRRGLSGNPVFDETIEQGNVSLITPLWGRHWHLFGKLQYDFEQHRSIEELIGLEYSNCCIRLRTLYRDGLDGQFDGLGEPKRDRSVFLQVQLKGLVGIGNTVENILRQAIPGYSERDQYEANQALSF